MSVLLDRFRDTAKDLVLNKGEVLFRQHSKASNFYLLEKGSLEFLGSSGSDSVLLGRVHSSGVPIGLSAFVSPFRFEFTVVISSDQATIKVWQMSELHDLLTASPNESIEFFQFINTNALALIEESSELFMTISGATEEIRPDKFISEGDQSPIEQSEDDAVLFLLQSPFFEVFDEKHLRYLAGGLKRFQFPAGTTIHEQGAACEGIDILASGEIQFSRLNDQGESKQTVWFRSISTPGYLLGVSGVLNQKSNLTSVVSKDALVYHLPLASIREVAERDISFGVALQNRLTWFLANQFRIIQTRLLSAEFEEEIILVTNLIENNQSKIGLYSDLHKIPLLLQDKITSSEAFGLLHTVELNGPENERNLASLCLDNLKQTEREIRFFNGLMNIYNCVAQSPVESAPSEVQGLCNRASREAFAIPSIQLSGYENLPERPGKVFIYNHLLNDPHYSLPNQFQITLDAHYISHLLFEKYNEPAMRIVRIGRDSEYAHEDYYERLGFINVFTSESEEVPDSEQKKANDRELLRSQMEELLMAGKNIIVSPEGTSYPSEQSPGRFKSGIFRLLLQMKTEPLIVPIVMANFDKRIPNIIYKCNILSAFRLSEEMKSMSETDVKAFLRKYKRRYKEYVNELVGV